MSFEEPTYEEYKKATAWARFRYKYSLLVLILFWLAFIFVIFYMVYNGEAIARHPLIYGADKYDVSCVCTDSEGNSVHVNGSRMWSEGTRYSVDTSEIEKINITTKG